MTFRNLLLLAAVLGVTQNFALPQLAPPPPDSNSALMALGILPPQYQGNVVKLSADNGDPDPAQWYVLAYRDSPDGGPFQHNDCQWRNRAGKAISESWRVVQESELPSL